MSKSSGNSEGDTPTNQGDEGAEDEETVAEPELHQTEKEVSRCIKYQSCTQKGNFKNSSVSTV